LSTSRTPDALGQAKASMTRDVYADPFDEDLDIRWAD
jgi:hypothetical protein